MATAKAAEGGFIAKLKRPFVNMGRFLREVWSELQRVVWPTHEESKGYTVVVLVTVVIVALWVAIWDYMFGSLVGLLERL